MNPATTADADNRADYHAPFLRLQRPAPCALAAWAPILAYRGLDGERPRMQMQRVLSTHFRSNLVRQVRRPGYAVWRPTDTSEPLRSPEWRRFAERVEDFERGGREGDESAVALIQTCLALAFHRHVLRLLPGPPDAGELAASEVAAALAYQRAFARRMVWQDAPGRVPTDDLEALVRHAPATSRVRFYAASALLVHHAKVTRDRAAARECREVMEALVPAAPGTPDELMDLSRHWRCVSFVPFLAGDSEAVTGELEEAESIARALVSEAPSGSPEELIALDNLHAVLESRMREAMWLGDLDTALARITEVNGFDPLDSKAHIEAGQVRLRRGEDEAASRCFAAAARCGPPGTAVAYYLEGTCRERLSQPERALDCYLAALDLDPGGVSPLEGLERVASRLRRRDLCDWARRRRHGSHDGSADAGRPLGTARHTPRALTFAYHRPYVDLEAAEDMPLGSHGPLIAYQNLDGHSVIGSQHCHGERLRQSLLRQARLRGHGLYDPRRTQPPLRGARWQHLCELVDAFPGLPIVEQVSVCRLLISLSFHRLVLRLVPAAIQGDGEQELTLAFMRAFAEYTLRIERGQRDVSGDLQTLEARAGQPSPLRFNLAMLLLNDCAKVRRDAQGARHYREVARHNSPVDLLDDRPRGFASALTISRYWRGASFVPFLEGDAPAVTREMDRALATARAAREHASTPTETVLAREAECFVTESRLREAQWIGERDLAVERAKRLTVLDPLGSRAWIEYAEVLVGCGQVEAAERSYLRAAQLGPPGTPVALFMAGQCRERMGDFEGACDLYVRALDVDPRGMATLRSLAPAARRSGQHDLAAWSARRLQDLGARAPAPA